MINNELLRQALHDKKQIRARNEALEARRRQEVMQSSPAIAALVAERQDAIAQGLRLALEGLHPGDIEAETVRRNREIRRLLKKDGFAEDYLSPIHECPVCGDSGYAGDEVKTLCRCVVDRYQRLLQGDAFVTETQTFESYDEQLIPAQAMPGKQVSQRAYTQLLKEECERYADQLPKGPVQNLLLYGGSGLGKTFLLRAIGARASQRGLMVMTVTANTLLNRIRKNYFSREEAETPYEDVPLLLIDDLGTEPLWQNITIEQLFALIEHRLEAGLHTVISTNMGLEELKERYTERITSRLLDIKRCKKLAFFGQDLRLVRR